MKISNGLGEISAEIIERYLFSELVNIISGRKFVMASDNWEYKYSFLTDTVGGEYKS
jgi:hypothetical protein